MKKLAFFMALFIGLNATTVVRRPEEEEGQVIVKHESHPASYRKYAFIIQLLAERLNQYLYAITKEGVFHKIIFERFTGIINNHRKQDKITKIVFDLHHDSTSEFSNIQLQK